MGLSLMLAAGLTSGLLAPADAGDAITLHRLRSMDVTIRATIDEGCRRSPTFAALVNYLERSSFIVYVEQTPALRDGMRGTLLHGGAGPRYLRVFLKRGMSLEHRVVVLAHELQHVREVVAAGIVADAVEMDALFRRIADERSAGRKHRYETAAALRVADTVVADLRAGRGAGKGVGHCPAGDRVSYDPDQVCERVCFHLLHDLAAVSLDGGFTHPEFGGMSPSEFRWNDAAGAFASRTAESVEWKTAPQVSLSRPVAYLCSRLAISV